MTDHGIGRLQRGGALVVAVPQAPTDPSKLLLAAMHVALPLHCPHTDPGTPQHLPRDRLKVVAGYTRLLSGWIFVQHLTSDKVSFYYEFGCHFYMCWVI